jgi:hypothetical protein
MERQKGVTVSGSVYLSYLFTKVLLYYLGLPNYFDELASLFPGVLYGW